MKRNWLFLLLLIVFISCNNDTGCYIQFITPAKPTLSVADKKPKEYKILDVSKGSIYDNFDRITFIPLETTDKSLIGKVNEIRIIDDRIYVCDKMQSQTIFVFDINGHYLHKIGQPGHGKQEYLQIMSYWFHDQYVDFLDCTLWKVVRYDLDGHYIKTIDLSSFMGCSRFIEYEKNKYIFVYQQYSKEHPYRLVYTDSLFNIEQTALPFEHTRDMPVGSFWGNSTSGYNCYFDFNDTIYSMSDSLIVPKYHLSFYKKGEVLEYLKKTSNLQHKDYLNDVNSDKKDLVKGFTIFDLDSNLFVSYRLGHEGYFSVVSKENNTHYTYKGANYDKRDGYSYAFFPYGTYKNNLISIVDKSIVSLLSDEALSEFKKRIVKRKGIDIDKVLNNDSDNPTICLLHINRKK